jgi:hypothetical protein
MLFVARNPCASCRVESRAPGSLQAPVGPDMSVVALAPALLDVSRVCVVSLKCERRCAAPIQLADE